MHPKITKPNPDLLKQISDKTPVILKYILKPPTDKFSQSEFPPVIKSINDQILQLNLLKHHTHQRPLPLLRSIIFTNNISS